MSGSTTGMSSISSPRTSQRPAMTSEAGREQALRDYKLTIEYKHLKQHAPSGVYLVPSMDNIRKLYGVIFIRRGMSMYANGIFKFTLTLPPLYNSIDSWPSLCFTTPVFNPHVHPESGELDLRYEYSTWDPHRHYLVTILTYIKKIFYLDFTNLSTDYAQDPDLNYFNPEAIRLARTDPEAFQMQVDECVKVSQQDILINHPDCTIVFNEPSICHQILVDALQREWGGEDSNSMARATVLQCVSTAHNSAFGDLNKT
jgi:ubiquitin-protein ligase